MTKKTAYKTNAEPLETDGRRARSGASRQRIVEAMLALVREGDLEPSADAVAERAGVGRRTVFRLFNDMDSLYGAMHAAMVERIEHILRTPLAGGAWRERLDGLIDRRIRFFEEVLPVKAAADAQRHRSPFLRRAHRNTTQSLREMLLFVLPKQIKDDPLRFEALDMVLSIEAWRRLRYEQRLSAKTASLVLKRSVAALLG